MNKKRDDYSSLWSRQGQITIFIILGIVILVVFLFLIFIVNTTQKGNLKAEQAKAFESIYSKEGIHLYLDTCLKDSLAGALTAIQRQGRLWRDIDPGGFIPFEEGKTGVTVDGVPIAYGLIYTPFPTFPEAYPCSSEEGNPSFCNYLYPMLGFRFGELALTPSTIEDDVGRYLKTKVVSCAQQLATEDISADASVEIPNPKFAVTLQSEGIAVDATIPFSLTLRGIKYFTTSSFQFFYDTPLRKVVETAAYFPLQADRDYADFRYDEDVLISESYSLNSDQDLKSSLGLSACMYDPSLGYFVCSQKLASGYSGLGVEMKKKGLDNGDMLFTFSSPMVTYSFVRQNRPPALNYVSRFACPAGDYDYLAIAGDPVLGTVDITATALDPDEQMSTQNIENTGTPVLLDEDPTNDRFLLTQSLSGRYHLTASATDEKLTDTQEVRILVDNPISSMISVEHFYPDLITKMENIALISPEDPIKVKVKIPDKSLTGDLGEFHFSFNDGLKETVFDLLPPQDSPLAAVTDYSFVFPFHYEVADLIRKIVDPSHFKYAPFVEAGKQGTFTLDYKINYCGYHEQSSKSAVDVVINPCLPYRNPERPFPYPHQNFVDANKDGIADEQIPLDDPFMANHTCCLGDPTVPAAWRIATPEDNVACFKKNVDEQDALGCFGDTNTAGKGYLLEKRTLEMRYCNGFRGNTCEGATMFQAEAQQLCGSKNQKECTLVAKECQELPPYSKGMDTTGKGFWCVGPVGCGDAEGKTCTTEIVTKVGGFGFDYVQTNPKQYACECTGQTVNWDCLKLKDNSVGKCTGLISFRPYSCQ